MVRAFVAVLPPQDVDEHLAGAVEPVRDDVLRWSDRAAWHITLAFYGEIDEAALESLCERIARAASRYPAVELHLSGAGRFGSSALWVGVGGDVTVLTGAARSVAAAGRRAGAQHDNRRFHPHVTLARARRPVDLRPYVERMASYEGPRWTAADVALIRSHPPSEPYRGPHYEVLRRFPLGAG